MDMDASFLEQFVEEALENIEELVNGLLRLENEAGDEAAHTVKELFRFAHNLKGMSGAMGLDGITTVSHKMEDLLDQYRSGQGLPSSDEVDVLLSAADGLQGMVELSAEGENPPADQDLVTLLIAQVEGQSDEASSDSEEVVAEGDLELPPAPDGGVWVAVKLADGAQLAGARSAMVLQGAERNGQIVDIFPDRGTIETGTAQKFAFCIDGCDDLDPVIEALAAITDIDSVEIYVAPEPEVVPGSADSDGDDASIRVEVRLNDDVQLPGARAAIVLRYFGDHATISSTNPDRQTIEAGKVKSFIVGIEPVDDEQTLFAGCLELTDVVEVKKLEREERRVEDRRKGGAASKATAARSTVRVDVARLDDLMDLVSELVVARGQLDEQANRIKDRNLTESLGSMHRTVSDLQAMVAKVRMISLEGTFARINRIVRDTSRDVGKEINFIMSGEETELDRGMVDAVADPLMHLLRNSVDHGIENDSADRVAAGKSPKGQIGLKAFTEGNQVVIEVTDDGNGIDVDRVLAKAIQNGVVSEDKAPSMTYQDKLELVFAAGLSTRDTASTISGRGVGMDVVRTAAVKLGGNVTVESTPGKGSIFTIRLPLSLAVAEALLISVCEETWCVPIDQIEETLKVEEVQVRTVRGAPVIDLRGEVIPLVHGSMVLYGLPAPEGAKEAVVFRYKGRRTALTVDSLIGRFEVVVKPLPGDVTASEMASAVTILGDGSVGLIMNVGAVAEQRRSNVSAAAV